MTTASSLMAVARGARVRCRHSLTKHWSLHIAPHALELAIRLLTLMFSIASSSARVLVTAPKTGVDSSEMLSSLRSDQCTFRSGPNSFSSRGFAYQETPTWESFKGLRSLGAPTSAKAASLG